jgi:hypothetical protein
MLEMLRRPERILRLAAAATLAAGLLWNTDGLAREALVGTGDYVVRVAQPAYRKDTGPRIAIDEAHFNYQTTADRFKGFADLMTADGARVSPLREKFSAASLANIDVLVICNALNEKNAREKQTANKWVLPSPSAFEDGEIAAVVDWVRSGGALLLIADHMPFPGAAEKLGDALGVVMGNNFAFDAGFTYRPGDMNLMYFRQTPVAGKSGTLHPGPATGSLPFVVSFTGQGFRVKPGTTHTPVLELGDGTKIAWPMDHVDISPKTPFAGGAGLLQGALLQVGKGRVGVFGEASMFSVNFAEWAGNYPTGFHNPDAPHNQQFVLNVMRWLANGR